MEGPLLETKLYLPRRTDALVPRPRLTERLNRGAESKLTLVSAQAGFGKTTLLADWLAAGRPAPGPVAWLSLDQADNHPAVYWTYVIAALQTAVPGAGASASELLRSPQPPPIEAILATLLNELGAIATEIVLVLDDYHLIDEREIEEGMAFLLDHLPPCLHVVIASRADPALPLARLRARGELVELRAADLRFLPEEAAAYLNEVMRLDLAAGDLAALEGRTEGWIAALQLAALSLKGRADVAGFIAGFAGDDRYIVDYLVQEVLQRQPDHVRSFLLQTSILDRLSGPLCDAVTGQAGGKAMLEALERGNVFVVPLDDRRRWYRFHQLFADVLRAHLADEQPGRVFELHRRAAIWFEQNGERSEAIRHALAGDDFAMAADLVELALPALRKGRQEATALGWLKALPDEVVRCRPVLSIGYVGALMAGGEPEAVDAHLRDAERWLGTAADTGEGPAPTAKMIVVDKEELRGLPGMIAVYRAAQALIRGDGAETAQYAGRAFDLLPPDYLLGRGAAAGLLGLASWASGDLEAAHRMYTECATLLERAGHIADTFGCAIALADMRIAQGRLGDAMRTYERALQRGMERGGPVLRGTADMHVGMSEIDVQRNDLHAAAQHLVRSEELGVHAGLPQNRYRWCVAMARVREAHGDLDGALDLLHEAQRLYVGDFFPNVRPVPAMKARVSIAQERFGQAIGWADEHGLSAADELSYLHEFEHITLARLLLARSKTGRTGRKVDEALGLLERLLHAAQEGGRTGAVIEILMLQALGHRTEGDMRRALAALECALSLAEPEGYVRLFVNEGPPMAVLLAEAAKQGIAPSYARLLLANVGKPEETTLARQGSSASEALSERELEVLRLLATDLNGPDIARELVVSLNTMRTHTKNIYAKLGVNTRRTAIRRAEELGLL